MKKKLISLCLALVMVLSLLPVTGWAEETAGGNAVIMPRSVGGTCGGTEEFPVTWSLNNGLLTLSGEGAMDDAAYDGYPWYEWKSEITSVTVGSGITYVADYAFRECENLTEVVLGEDVTTIGDSAFAWCTALEKITIPDGLQVFEGGCLSGTAISEIYIPESVTVIEGSAFSNTALVSVKIPDGVQIGTSIFENCTELVTVELGKDLWFPYEESGGINDGMFSGCTSLKTVTVPEGAASVRMNAFRGCTNLETVILPDSIQYLDMNAFSESGLKYIVIPANVQHLYSAFYNCAELEEITFTGDHLATLDDWTFTGVTATVYYPAGNETWTEDVLKNYGGNLTWVAYTSENTVQTGDASGDGVINNIDAMQVLQYAVGLRDADTFALSACDVNGDGVVNNIDAMLILQYAVGLITEFLNAKA